MGSHGVLAPYFPLSHGAFILFPVVMGRAAGRSCLGAVWQEEKIQNCAIQRQTLGSDVRNASSWALYQYAKLSCGAWQLLGKALQGVGSSDALQE